MLLIAILGYGFEGALKFGFYETLKHVFAQITPHQYINFFLASIVAGAIASVVLVSYIYISTFFINFYYLHDFHYIFFISAPLKMQEFEWYPMIDTPMIISLVPYLEYYVNMVSYRHSQDCSRC